MYLMDSIGGVVSGRQILLENCSKHSTKRNVMVLMIKAIFQNVSDAFYWISFVF